MCVCVCVCARERTRACVRVCLKTAISMGVVDGSGSSKGQG